MLIEFQLADAEVELKDLRAENERLKRLNTEMGVHMLGLGQKLEDLRAENADFQSKEIVFMAESNERHTLAMEQKDEEHKKAIVQMRQEIEKYKTGGVVKKILEEKAKEINRLKEEKAEMNRKNINYVRKMYDYWKDRATGKCIQIERFHSRWQFKGDWYKEPTLQPSLKILTDTFQCCIWGQKVTV
jgi:G3E family GTPase